MEGTLERTVDVDTLLRSIDVLTRAYTATASPVFYQHLETLANMLLEPQTVIQHGGS